MARTKTPLPDRYLVEISGRWHYRRAVPTDLHHLDGRAPRIQKALKTSDIEIARRRRDDAEERDDSIWAAMRAGGVEEIRRAFDLGKAAGFPDDLPSLRKAVKAAAELSSAPVALTGTRVAGEILPDHLLLDLGYRRGEILPVSGSAEQNEQRAAAIDAIFGDARSKDAGRKKLSEVLEDYIGTICEAMLARKSEEQRRNWENTKRRAWATLIEVVGDIEFSKLTPDHARAFRNHLRERLINPDDKFGYDAAKRQLGDARGIAEDYISECGLALVDPFKDLPRLKKPKIDEEGRETIPADVVAAMLQNPLLKRLGHDQRMILLVVAMTGARPSEIMNLRPSQIHLCDPVPHISIRAEERELKNKQSIRRIPLVGLALQVMKRCPDGWPSQHDNSNGYSANVNKLLKKHKIFDGEQTVYGLRHGAEDRLKDAAIPDDIRRRVLGHAENREQYGRHFTAETLLPAMMALDLPYDPDILT